MKRRSSGLFMFFLLFCISKPYSQVSIKGRIMDTFGQGVHRVSVKGVTESDSVIAFLSETDLQGYFQIKNIPHNRYYVLVEKVGYSIQYLPLVIKKDSIYIIPDIQLEKDAVVIDEVIVGRKINPIKLTPGKLSYEVQKSPFGSVGSALDVLQRMPGVVILPNGKISLNGEEGVQLLIDGKTNFMTGDDVVSYLSAIPASSLDIVELISQPSAEMEAAGSARFINLKRNVKPSKGINAVISSNTEKGRFYRMHHNIGVEANLNKVNISNSYSYSRGTDLVDVTSSRYLHIYPDGQQKPLQLDMDAERKKKYENHYYNGQIDYNPNKILNLGAYVLLNNTTRGKDELVNSTFLYNHTNPDSTIKTNNLLEHRFRNRSMGAHANVQISADSKWETYVDRQVFRQDEQQQQWSSKFIENVLGQQDGELQGGTRGKVNITTVQSKYGFSLLPNLMTSIGGKYTFVKIGTNSLYRDFVKGQWQDNVGLSNAFDHEERLKALFMQLQYNATEALRFDMGLRYEDATFYSVARTYQNTNMPIERKYNNLFPNVTMAYTIDAKQQISIHYNRRVNRPNFRDLNPFVEVNDPYLHDKGNPSLKPEFVNNMELTWAFRNAYSLQLFYSLKQDPISKSYNLDSLRRAVVMPLNLRDGYSVGIRFNATSLQPLRIWQVQANANLIYRSFQWISGNVIHKNTRLTPAIQLQNQVKLPFKTALEVNGFCSGTMVEGQAEILPLWSVNTALRKTLLQDKFTLYIYANDVFRSNRPRINIFGDIMTGNYQETYDSRAIGIRLSYRLSRGNKVQLRNNNEPNRLEESNRVGN